MKVGTRTERKETLIKKSMSDKNSHLWRLESTFNKSHFKTISLPACLASMAWQQKKASRPNKSTSPCLRTYPTAFPTQKKSQTAMETTLWAYSYPTSRKVITRNTTDTREAGNLCANNELYRCTCKA